MENFLLIALCISIGIISRKSGRFPAETPHVLNMFALHLSLPALIMLKIPQIRFNGDALVPVATAWGALFLSAAIILLLARLFSWPGEVTGVLLLVVPLGNTSFMGVPVVNAFFGEAGLPHLVMYDQFGTMLIFATYGSIILARYGDNAGGGSKEFIKRSLLFPPSLALVAGLALNQYGYPPLLNGVLQAVAATLTPLVMTAVGFSLRLNLKPTLHKPLWIGLSLKMVLAPLAALLFCRLFGVDGIPPAVSVIEAGMPPMVTAGAVAVAAGMNAELAAALIGIGLLLSFVTLPLLYMLTLWSFY